MNIYNKIIRISVMNEAAQWLKEKRGRLSFRDLAEDTGLSHMTLVKAETGDASADTWILLAEYFNESVLKVLWWAGKKKKPPTNEELQIETEGRIGDLLLSRFPPEEYDNIIRRLTLEAQLYHEKEASNKRSNPRPRRAE